MIGIIQSTLVLKAVYKAEGHFTLRMWNSWTGCSTVTIVLISFIMYCDGFLVHSIMMPFQLTNYELNTLAENLPLAESENEK